MGDKLEGGRIIVAEETRDLRNSTDRGKKRNRGRQCISME